MQLIALGGDERMNGLLRAARRKGFDCSHIRTVEELKAAGEKAAAAILPWPRSLSAGKVSQTQITQEALHEYLPPCEVLMGGAVRAEDFPQAGRVVDPGKDETLLSVNARLTAEGTVSALLSCGGAVMGKTCLVTGFGRIAQALVRRMTAMETFVIVCARNAGQMQLAHRMGAHPVPIAQLASACLQADIVLNTVPARIFTGEALAQMKPGVRYIELASAPYGADPQMASDFGVSMEIMGGLPGKYAPQQAGEALFDVLERAMQQAEGEEV